jgi:uncharacterized protein (DUF433 family)
MIKVYAIMQILTNQGAYPMQDLLQRITIDSEICHGKPSIRGLRYPVETILQLLSSGMSTEEILEDYEDLEKEDIMASLLYASKLTEVKSIYKLDVA